LVTDLFNFIVEILASLPTTMTEPFRERRDDIKARVDDLRRMSRMASVGHPAQILLTSIRLGINHKIAKAGRSIEGVPDYNSFVRQFNAMDEKFRTVIFHSIEMQVLREFNENVPTPLLTKLADLGDYDLKSNAIVDFARGVLKVTEKVAGKAASPFAGLSGDALMTRLEEILGGIRIGEPGDPDGEDPADGHRCDDCPDRLNCSLPPAIAWRKDHGASPS
jgi:hypothetical protein